MSTQETITTLFDEEDLARIDALAQKRGISREEMISQLVRSGLAACEQEDAPPATQPPKADAS